MTAIISISHLVNLYQKQNNPSQVHLDGLKKILEEWRDGRRIDNYKEYVPFMNLDHNPPNRRKVGEILYFVWKYCQQNMLPELNFMIINKRTRLPGNALLEDWMKKYGTEWGYEGYCTLRAREAKCFLDNKFITIID